MIDLTSYNCNVVEETAAEKAARYRELNDGQLKGMYEEALKRQEAGKPWKDSTLEALTDVCVDRGVISFTG